MANFSAMNSAIANYIKSKTAEDKNRVMIGTLGNKKITVGNKSYSYDAISDMTYNDEDQVCFLLPESGNDAVVIGKV